MKRIYSKSTLFLVISILLTGYGAEIPAAVITPENEFLNMDFAELMAIEITSVAKKPQNLFDAAAAVFVISSEDIKRSGATSIPEALRMAPGLQVARISSNRWAITSRGFNGGFSNKLLVLIDGRTVYTSNFSGVYWNVQDYLLEDIEQIEIIRGPGATLWGANAVNGIINIITKKAKETQGWLVTAGAGTEEHGFGTVRYGMKLGDTVHGRSYLTYHDRNSFVFESTGKDAGDSWEIMQAGFRLDGEVGARDSWTLHGDVYDGDENQTAPSIWSVDPPYSRQNVDDNFDSSGWNLFGKWRHDFSETDSWTFQVYYDFTNRDEIYLEQTHHTFDVDFQYRFQAGESHGLILGMGYRVIHDDFGNTFQVSYAPDNQTRNLFSAFLQDTIMLIPDTLWLTIGSKFEKNDYTGEEIQPNGRILWKPQANQTVWAAVSRAVRTPSRYEDSGRVIASVIPLAPPPTPPLVISFNGSADVDSEDLVAYEAGYRFTHSSKWTMDIALFYNDYDNLVTWEMSQTGSSTTDNKMQGESYGIELAAQWQPSDWMTLEGAYTYLQLKMETDSGSLDIFSTKIYEESTPVHQVSIRSSFDIWEKWQLNLWARYVDALETTSYKAIIDDIVINDYLTLDANLIWRPTTDLEFMLVGQNLLDQSHMEFVEGFFTSATEVERSVYGKLTWRF